MLDRWAELREVLEAGLLWQAPDRFKAVRLLGKQPLDAATDWRVMKIYFAAGAMNPKAPLEFKDLADEMFLEQKKIFAERVSARLVAGVRPSDPEGGKAALLELIAEEEERLEALLSDHLERTEPTVGESFDTTDAGERLRRYQAACDRGLLRVLEAIRKRQREADRAGIRLERGEAVEAGREGPEGPVEADRPGAGRDGGGPRGEGDEPGGRPARLGRSEGRRRGRRAAVRDDRTQARPPGDPRASDDRSQRPRGRAGLLGLRHGAPRPGRRAVRGRSRATEANPVDGTNGPIGRDGPRSDRGRRGARPPRGRSPKKVGPGTLILRGESVTLRAWSI